MTKPWTVTRRCLFYDVPVLSTLAANKPSQDCYCHGLLFLVLEREISAHQCTLHCTYLCMFSYFTWQRYISIITTRKIHCGFVCWLLFRHIVAANHLHWWGWFGSSAFLHIFVTVQVDILHRRKRHRTNSSCFPRCHYLKFQEDKQSANGLKSQWHATDGKKINLH